MPCKLSLIQQEVHLPRATGLQLTCAAAHEDFPNAIGADAQPECASIIVDLEHQRTFSICAAAAEDDAACRGNNLYLRRGILTVPFEGEGPVCCAADKQA